MKILTGFSNNMVIRRNRLNVSEQPFGGKCSQAGKIIATVRNAEDKIIEGFNAVKVGKAENGSFNGILKGLETGGPYNLKLQIGEESLQIKNILVGDVWILGGQSNMQGRGKLINAYKNSSPMVRAYYMEERWGYAKDPVIVPQMSEFDAHWNILPEKKPDKIMKWKDPFDKGTGPGVAFANELYKMTGIPQGIIACAHGGSSMTQWSPELKKTGTDSLYGAMLHRVNLNGGLVSGMIWYQGCSETNQHDASLFARRMQNFVKNLRNDFNYPEMPFIQVQLARLVYGNERLDSMWTVIREIQRTMHTRIKNLLTVPAIDLELDDHIHLCGKSQNILGRRLAEAVITINNDKNSLPPPIELKSVCIVDHLEFSEKQVEISFKNVVGSLVSGSRPNGFSFNCVSSDFSFNTELKDDKVILHCPHWKGISYISYGYGTNPYCNITDEAGRSIPAFAPYPVYKKNNLFKKAFTSFMEVSEPLFGDEDIDKVMYKNSLNLSYSTPVQSSFGVVPADRASVPDKEAVRFFRTAYIVPEQIKLTLLLGYDGPVKFFFNGKDIFTDKNGSNPLVPARQKLIVDLQKGKNQFVFALALNHNKSWGVSLGIEISDDMCYNGNRKNPIPLPLETKFLKNEKNK